MLGLRCFSCPHRSYQLEGNDDTNICIHSMATKSNSFTDVGIESPCSSHCRGASIYICMGMFQSTAHPQTSASYPPMPNFQFVFVCSHPIFFAREEVGGTTPWQAFPSCYLKHLFVMEALEAFAKIHESKIGTDLRQGLFLQISLSLRVLLLHFRQCAQDDGTWARAKRCYKGDKSLSPVEAIIEKIELPEEEPEDEKNCC